jgi:hypothetical protein
MIYKKKKGFRNNISKTTKKTTTTKKKKKKTRMERKYLESDIFTLTKKRACGGENFLFFFEKKK